MPKIRINQKQELINVISNLGIELEVGAETLERWNHVIGKWWDVQLEIDKYIKAQND